MRREIYDKFKQISAKNAKELAMKGTGQGQAAVDIRRLGRIEKDRQEFRISRISGMQKTTYGEGPVEVGGASDMKTTSINADMSIYGNNCLITSILLPL